MDNRAVGKVLRYALSRKQGSVPYPCPDDSLVAAYLDGRLTPAEKVTFEEHASRCGSCRQVVGLALAMASPASAGTGRAARISARDASWWLRSPIAAAAAAVLVVAAGAALFTLAPGPPVRTPAPEVSTLRAPAEKTKAPAEVRVVPLRQKPAAAASASSQDTQGGRRARLGDQGKSGDRDAIKTDAAVLGGATAVDAAAAESQVAAAAPQLQAENKSRPAEFAGQDKSVDDRRDEPRLARRASIAAVRLGPSQAVQMLAERGEAAFGNRVLDGMTFFRVGDYWIDRRCAAQPNPSIVEISPGSTEERQIMTAAPHLRELMQGAGRVIVRHAGAVCVLENQDR